MELRRGIEKTLKGVGENNRRITAKNLYYTEYSMNDSLMAYMQKARWFMAKDRAMAKLTILENIPLYQAHDNRCSLLLLEVFFADRSKDFYIFPLGIAQGRKKNALKHKFSDVIIHEEENCVYYDALAEPSLAVFLASPWLTPRTKPREVPGGSNSGILFPGECFIKMYRRVQSGPHPESEMGIFLRKKKFPCIATVFGYWKYGEYTIAIVQQALKPGQNVWSLLGKKPCMKKSALLGKRLAQMHLALGKGREVAFIPESFTSLYRKQQNKIFLNLAKQVQEQLQRALPGLSNKYQRQIHKVLHIISLLPQKRRRLMASNDVGMRIRIHGDLHLGQIHWNSPDFFFMDFEGEPARSLAFRREKHSPLRDVAGMLRSFAYADAHFKGQRPNLAKPFLEAYWKEMGDSSLLPAKEENREALLSDYVLEKALYEISYEIGNRPAWLPVAICGLAGE